MGRSLILHSPIHTDELYAPFGFSWGTLHETDDTCDVSGGRSPGGNFVDVSLRVVVKGAPDTLMVGPCFRCGGYAVARTHGLVRSAHDQILNTGPQ